MKRLWQFFRLLRPPRRWHLAVLLLLGLFSGLFALVFHVSRASSYLGEAPETCVNCHIMAPQYATWERGSHARVATCNDCHVPHDNLFRKYAFKASDGMRHATIFTLRLEPQVIRVHEAGIQVVQENCLRCHQHQLHQVMGQSTPTSIHDPGDRLCWECHRETPHGRVNSLSAVPHARLPEVHPLLPQWLQDKAGSNSNSEPPKSHEKHH